MQWKDGSPEKVALHGLVGYLSAKVGGGNTAAGALSAMGSEYINTEIANYLKENTQLTPDQRNAIQQLSAAGIGAVIGAGLSGDSNMVKQAAQMAARTERFNRQLHPDEKQRIEELVHQLAKEKGGSEVFWQEQLTLVVSAMIDEKENQQIVGGLEAIFSGAPVLPQNRQDQEKLKESLAIAYHSLTNEAKKNQTLKWKDDSDVTLFGEKVKMFQSTEKQYKNSQMFGSLNYPSFNQYPNSNVATLGELGKLNGLDQNALKYQRELFNIIGNHHKSKPNNIGVLNAKYHQYYNGDSIEPVFWEGLVMSGSTANAVNKAVGSSLNTGKNLSSQVGGYLGNVASKYPKTYETIVSGSVATGFDMYNNEESLEKTGFNFILGRMLVNKPLSTQLSVNIGSGYVLSVNENNSNEKVVTDTLKKGISTGSSFGVESVLSKTKIGNAGKPFISNIIGGMSEIYLEDEKDNKKENK